VGVAMHMQDMAMRLECITYSCVATHPSPHALQTSLLVGALTKICEYPKTSFLGNVRGFPIPLTLTLIILQSQTLSGLCSHH
jgi:hypothetical protein